MSSLHRMLGILGLFTEHTNFVCCEDVEITFNCSRATAYRYLSNLADAGLVSKASENRYVLGSRIIELDRLLRRTDPVLQCAGPIMEMVSAETGFNILLCNFYGDKVTCVHAVWPNSSIEQRYERGKPMPLFRGALAKVILANLKPHQLKNIMLFHAEDIRRAGLGENWRQFKDNMIRIKIQGYCITKGELAPESVGVAAPIMTAEKRVLGSVVFAIPNQEFEAFGEDYACQKISDLANSITVELEKYYFLKS